MIDAVYAQAAPSAFDALNSLIVPTVLIIGILLSGHWFRSLLGDFSRCTRISMLKSHYILRDLLL